MSCGTDTEAELGDRMSGQIIVAKKVSDPARAPQISVPPALAAKVTSIDYNKDGFLGSQTSFSDLTFGEFSQLPELINSAYSEAGVKFEIRTIARRGETVSFRGSATLTPLVAKLDYLVFTVQFGGPVNASNGAKLDDSSVTWKPTPGENNQFSAESTYADPGTAAFGGWTAVIVVLCLLSVGAVAILAWLSRDQSLRPGTTVESLTPRDIWRRIRSQINSTEK